MLKKRVVYWISLSIFVAILIGLSVKDNVIFAKKTKNLEEVLTDTGLFIKQHPEYLTKSLEALESNNSVETDDIIAWVDDMPITIHELKFRKGMIDSFGSETTDLSTVFNILVEEKMVINLAAEKNLLPTNNEIDEYINNQKLEYNDSNLGLRSLVDNFIEKTGITLDDYWNVYTRYNAYRIIVLEKVFSDYISQSITSGKLPSQPEIISDTITAEYYSYWKAYKLNKKSNVKTKINHKYNDLKLVVDHNKLSTIK